MTTAPTPALLPCPFCNGKPHHGKMMDESMWSRRRVPWRRVRCNECDIGTDWVCKGASPSEIERWNRRAEPEARKPLQAPAYRVLEAGKDIVAPEDEFLQEDATTWARDPGLIFVGMAYCRVLKPARRRVTGESS